ncbi:MAG: site-2 protease family protein [Akkermansiaceae bacterium]|nr:site-2 protease family protein [Armatimonadota bacterium]
MFDLPTTREDWVIRIMTLVSLIASLTIHEFAHAKAADYLGDDTPRRQGRVTLNPVAHLDPIGTIGLFVIVLAGFGFGWGKPVITNPLNYSKASMRVGSWWVTAAGPLSNLVVAIVCALLIRFHAFDFDPTFTLRWAGITMAVNLGLFFFNLLPVPPLDGSKLILPLFNNRTADHLQQQYMVWGIFPMLALLMLRIPQMVLPPLITGFATFLLGY